MKLVNLTLENFGPFRSYEIPFASGDHNCFLLTGKNNEGKSSIILALKLLSAATRSIGRKQFRQIIDDQIFYKLHQPDIESLKIGRLLYNYDGDRAKICAQFDNKFIITVILDALNDTIYADYDGRIVSGIENTFGVLPPLGPLAEIEEFLTLKHVRSSINTSLAPRHLRNHFAQILTPEEYGMVQEIVDASWPSIELLPWESNMDNTLTCFFKEKRIAREICWAGQGLQVWFQIVTHLVRLRNADIVVLDEPEVNLHPEKQNDLIRLLREYHAGSALVATHSVELMNNVNVSHILHIQKSKSHPHVKLTQDRTSLEVIRSQIGSNFNLIASQFETFDQIVFTEDTADYAILSELASALGISTSSSFNIPVHGFSEYRKAIPFREAYKLLIGKEITYTMVLDRDYYPDAYLEKVDKELQKAGIKLVLTPGKEIENLFLAPLALKAIIPSANRKEWLKYWEIVFREERLDCYGSFLTLHEKFCTPHMDMKTVTTKFTPVFDTKWNDPTHRHLFIRGKTALQRLRGFYRDHTGKNLTQQILVDAAAKSAQHMLETFLKKVFTS